MGGGRSSLFCSFTLFLGAIPPADLLQLEPGHARVAACMAQNISCTFRFCQIQTIIYRLGLQSKAYFTVFSPVFPAKNRVAMVQRLCYTEKKSL